MNHADFVVDGVERFFDPNFKARGKVGNFVYRIPCQKCGNYFTRQVYRKDGFNLCDLCKKEMSKKIKQLNLPNVDNIKTKSEIRFENAVEEIKNQVKDFSKYEKAIDIARQRKDKYGSIPEAMVAIELIKLGYKIIPQQKIHKYKPDFIIPNEKIVIEVDGAAFHSKENIEREMILQMSLGFDWTIIHIPAEKIRKNIKKVNCIIDTFNKIP